MSDSLSQPSEGFVAVFKAKRDWSWLTTSSLAGLGVLAMFLGSSSGTGTGTTCRSPCLNRRISLAKSKRQVWFLASVILLAIHSLVRLGNTALNLGTVLSWPAHALCCCWDPGWPTLFSPAFPWKRNAAFWDNICLLGSDSFPGFQYALLLSVSECHWSSAHS